MGEGGYLFSDTLELTHYLILFVVEVVCCREMFGFPIYHFSDDVFYLVKICLS